MLTVLADNVVLQRRSSFFRGGLVRERHRSGN